MNQPIKFPDMRSRRPRNAVTIPPPSAYVQRIPEFPTSDKSPKSQRLERKRLMLWFGLAVALHAALLLGIWVMPTLRIKWEPSPDAWVSVTSIPEPAPAKPAIVKPKLSKPRANPVQTAPLSPSPRSADSRGDGPES